MYRTVTNERERETETERQEEGILARWALVGQKIENLYHLFTSLSFPYAKHSIPFISSLTRTGQNIFFPAPIPSLFSLPSSYFLSSPLKGRNPATDCYMYNLNFHNSKIYGNLNQCIYGIFASDSRLWN